MYRVGGDERPVTHFRGADWLTWVRSWENILKNGSTPTWDEVEEFLEESSRFKRPKSLGTHPKWKPKPKPKYGMKAPNGTTRIAKSEKEWTEHMKGKKSWFVEARLQYKRKLRLIRRRYLLEYERVKTLHDANLMARWKAHERRRQWNAEMKAARRVEMRHKQLELDAFFQKRREKHRVKARFNRQNKEMKARRLKVHIVNYLLKERARHWIHPRMDEQSHQLVRSPHLSTKLFENVENIVGFWPVDPNANTAVAGAPSSSPFSLRPRGGSSAARIF